MLQVHGLMAWVDRVAGVLPAGYVCSAKNIDKSVVAYENGDIEEIQPVGKSRVIDFKDNANAIKINYADTIITKTETMLYNF